MAETKAAPISDEDKNNGSVFDDLEIEADDDKTKDSSKDSVTLSKTKVVLAKKLLENIKENNDRLIRLLSEFISSEDEQMISIGQLSDEVFNSSKEKNADEAEGRIVEGVFDGENMIGPDGKQYNVPANYASKSKLVEGDILKLTITPRGTFIYKQIGPIERARIIGTLEQDSTGNFFIMSDAKKLRVLTASVTYYKGTAGDEIVVLVPKTGASKWAAVENVVKNNA